MAEHPFDVFAKGSEAEVQVGVRSESLEQQAPFFPIEARSRFPQA
jgi:hypothetical protein